MKKILLAALIIAAGLVSCKNKNAQPAEAVEGEVTVMESSDIAFVHLDTVLSQCDLFQTEGTALQQKTEKTQQSLAKREQNLQYEAQQLQEKYSKGLMTTIDAQKKQAELERRATALQNDMQREGKQLEEENMVFSNRAQDLIARAIEQINADGRYKLVIDAASLLDADSSLDITETVLAKVNELYAEDKKAESK